MGVVGHRGKSASGKGSPSHRRGDGKRSHLRVLDQWWEIAQLVDRHRLYLTIDVADWITQSESLPFPHFIPVDNHIALKSVQLPGILHSDPADRIIIATAISLGATLVSKDKKISSYSHVKTLW